MLRPIPSRILSDTALVQVCTGVDLYQNQTLEEYTVKRVHAQPTNIIIKTKDNTEAQLSALLFVDARRSRPRLEWDALLRAAHEAGGDMWVTVNDVRRTVMNVDAVPDDRGALHHYEVGCV